MNIFIAQLQNIRYKEVLLSIAILYLSVKISSNFDESTQFIYFLGLWLYYTELIATGIIWLLIVILFQYTANSIIYVIGSIIAMLITKLVLIKTNNSVFACLFGGICLYTIIFIIMKFFKYNIFFGYNMSFGYNISFGYDIYELQLTNILVACLTYCLIKSRRLL